MLSENPACVAPVQQRLSPTLVSILQPPAIDKIPMGIQAVSSGIQAVSSDIQAVSSGIQAVSSDIQAVSSGIQAVSSGIQAVSGDIQAVCGDIQAVSSGIQAVSSGIQAVIGDIQAVSGDILKFFNTPKNVGVGQKFVDRRIHLGGDHVRYCVNTSLVPVICVCSSVHLQEIFLMLPVTLSGGSGHSELVS